MISALTSPQSYTLFGYMRPFGVSAILGVVDKTGPQLYVVEPSGLSYGYFGAAVGKGRQAAKTELEKLKLREFTCKEAINDVARMYVVSNHVGALSCSYICSIHLVHDDVKDKVRLKHSVVALLNSICRSSSSS